MLNKVADGGLSPREAVARLTACGDVDIGFATVDIDRLHRRGLPEVIFAPGKSIEQIREIMRVMLDRGQNVLVTRITCEVFEGLVAAFPDARFHEQARAVTCDIVPLPLPQGNVTVITAGTGDIPVAEEAALAAERMGARIYRVYDVGVAGLHRLLRRLDEIRRARAVVVAAGMEGALPSVVAGLVNCPVIAVPTSVGYGMHLEGVSTLLAMLNTCVPGVSVVNVDNGFGAGVSAGMINRTGMCGRNERA